jgi:hypothetical protein
VLKPGFFTNEFLLELPFEYRLLFAGLWCHADRKGRLEDRPKRLRMLIFPADDVDIDAGLSALASKGFILRYEVDGQRYISIVKFLDHQKPHLREAVSTIPDPPISEQKHRSTTKVGAEHDLGSVEPGGDLGLGTWDLGLGSGGNAPAVPAVEVVGGGNPHSKPTNLINGSELRFHGQHAWCSWPERNGFCVPMPLHRELIGRLGTPTAEAELKGWYPSVVARYTGRGVGDKIFDFWNNEFAAWVGTVTQAPSQRRPTAVESNLRGLREDVDIAGSVALLEAHRAK